MTAWVCFLGMIETAAVALVAERKNFAAWAIKWDISLVAAVYSGVFCSGIAYYVQGIVMQERGPVFVAAFSPLCMVIVAVLSSFILAEQMFLGRLMGALVIVIGLYIVVWGKMNDYDTPTTEEQKLPIRKCELSPGMEVIMGDGGDATKS
ncbi:WAT1-related protein At2g37460-like [Andrographis paniculata]|uniref:WAT1-related protein At2g37460-like n=1 Tax=Andrographis paniculata TaxID=175694 RepID=UPI0021E8935F|nr:WAT1-related protein At2g37460-like [Andrographis paniculata]